MLGVDSCGQNTLLDILAFGAVKKLLFFLINTSLKPILGQSLGTKGCLSAVGQRGGGRGQILRGRGGLCCGERRGRRREGSGRAQVRES